jgi:ABC-type multidrug transport system ATPase subunit
MVEKYLLICRNLSKTYKESDRDNVALQNVSFSLLPKDILFICGLNGSGKTTLLKLIAGTEDMDEGGEILCCLDNNGPKEWLKYKNQNFTWIPQEIDDVIADHMRIDELISLSGAEKVKNLARMVEANWLTDCIEGGGKRKLVSELSAGQRQLLVGLLALSSPKPLLLLDEVFKSLDTKARATYWMLIENSVAELKNCVIIVSHDLAFALQHATQIIVLRNGKVALHTTPKDVTLSQLAFEVVKPK